MAIEPELELAIGGAFTDITEDAYFEEGLGQTVGASAEGSETESTVADLALKSPDGKYANRNPLSPYYGQIGRNTLARASAAGGYATLLFPQDSLSSKASTPDSVGLSVTGDIDIRVDLTPDAWSGNFVVPPDTTSGFLELAGKFTHTSSQRSWAVTIRSDGRIALTWSTTGANSLTLSSTDLPPFGPRRRGAIRVTLDVNNGAGGHTARFYTSDTISGSWTQLGDAVVGSGTTSIFDSTAPVDIGNVTGIGSDSSTRRAINALEVRSGIGGTVVASPTFLGGTIGAPTLTDAQGNIWTFSGGAAITDRRNRFVVESSEWQPEWTVGADDVSTPVKGGGLLRRLEKGESPLESALRRRVPSFNPVAYWPMEDGENATEAGSAVPGQQALRVKDFTFGSDGTLGGSKAMPEVQANGWMRTPVGTAGFDWTDGWSVNMVYRYTGTRPPTGAQMLSWRTTGTVARWTILMRDGVATVRGDDKNFDQIFSTTVLVGDDVWDEFVRFRFTMRFESGNWRWRLTFVNIGQGGGSMSDTISGTPGMVSSINTTFGATIADGRLIVGHLSVEAGDGEDPYTFADHGYTGETAGARMKRLAEEEGIPLRFAGYHLNTLTMGPQTTDTFTELLRACEAVDGGVLYEDPERLGLIYRTRVTKYRQTPIIEIPYSSLVQPLRPTDDDELTRNDITRSRVEGASVVIRQETGPMSVELPPNGVGRYTDSQELNVELDGHLLQQAGWALHKGTWDEARYKKITILLHKHPELVPDLINLQIGDLIRITDLPEFLPPGPLDLIVEGFRENVTGLTWALELNCSPGGIWQMGVVDGGSAGTGDIGNRCDTSGSELLVGVSSSATSAYVQTTDGAQWITTADYGSQFPFDVTVGGEQVTVTAVAAAVYDTFTRTSASTWGDTESGWTWIEEGGAASDFNVTSGRGTHTLTSVNVSRRSIADVALEDVDVQADIQTSALATGGAITGAIVTRYGDSNNLYMARLTFNTDQTIDLQLRKRVAATETDLETVRIPLTHAANTNVRLRFQIIGSELRARAWNPNLPEPKSWQARATDTDLSGLGAVGFRSILLSGNTNVNPLVRYDNLQTLTPQLFTITRSVNGIVKAHDAGTTLSLTYPMRAGL